MVLASVRDVFRGYAVDLPHLKAVVSVFERGHYFGISCHILNSCVIP